MLHTCCYMLKSLLFTHSLSPSPHDDMPRRCMMLKCCVCCVSCSFQCCFRKKKNGNGIRMDKHLSTHSCSRLKNTRFHPHCKRTASTDAHMDSEGLISARSIWCWCQPASQPACLHCLILDDEMKAQPSNVRFSAIILDSPFRHS